MAFIYSCTERLYTLIMHGLIPLAWILMLFCLFGLPIAG